MRIMPTPLALLGIALLGGCAAAQSSWAAPRLEPDCSFRSASTCWTVAGRFPARRPKSAPPKGDEIRDPSPTAVASKADSAGGDGRHSIASIRASDLCATGNHPVGGYRGQALTESP